MGRFNDPKSPGYQLEAHLTRAHLEELVVPLVERCLDIISATLAETRVADDAVQAVLLVGGMSRMPLVRRRLTERFRREPAASGVSPDEAVALGAAVQAGELSARRGGVVLLDIVGSTLGVGIAGGSCKPLLPKRTRLPCQVTEIFHPSRDGQTVARIPVYQGESLRAHENFLLGELTLEGLRPGLRAQTSIAVSFEMGTDGVLSVNAQDDVTGRQETARIVARTDLQAAEAAHIAAEESQHLTTADRIEQEVRQKNVEVHGSLHEAILRLRSIHGDLTVAAAESPLPNAQQVVEALGQRLVEAEQVERGGSLEEVAAAAKSLGELERSLLG